MKIRLSKAAALLAAFNKRIFIGGLQFLGIGIVVSDSNPTG